MPNTGITKHYPFPQKWKLASPHMKALKTKMHQHMILVEIHLGIGKAWKFCQDYNIFYQGP